MAVLNSREDGRDSRVTLVGAVSAVVIVPLLFAGADGELLPLESDRYLVHGFLEWSAVCGALFTAFLGTLYLRVRADVLALTMATAALVGGFWDAHHALASMGLIGAASELSEIVPFTWSLSRTLKALVLTVGGVFILLSTSKRARLGGGWLLAGTAAASILGAVVFELAVVPSLPTALYPDDITGRLIKQPMELPALALFMLNGLLIFPAVVTRHPTLLSRALLLSAVPDAVSSATMILGSSTLYDQPSLVAHFFKLIACLVLLIGISVQAIGGFRRELGVADHLERAVTELTRVEDELHLTELRLSQLTNNIREVFWISSNDGKTMHYVSPTYEELFGLECEELYERSDAYMDVVHPDDRHLLVALQERDVQSDFEVEFRVVREDGEIRWLRTRGFPIRNDAGDIFRLAGLTEDVTGRRIAEEALRMSEARNRALFEAMPDLMFRLDRNGTILDYHARARIQLYAPPEDFLGKPVATVVPQIGDRILAHVRAALSTGSIQVLEYRLAAGGKDERDYEARVVRSSEDEVLAVVRDITEQKRLEKEVLEISNREQLRIGHDLHDGISQQLTGVALLCEALQKQMTARGLPEASKLKHIEELVDDAIAKTRGLARGLAPVELEAGGLSTALDELAHGIEARYSVRCRFRNEGNISIPGDATATHLYRIAQEAVTNALKHGDASSIAIELGRENGRARLVVEDDGCGMPVDAAGDGMGLHIMRYRARMIDASFEIGPARDQGTLVVCEWPRD